MKFCVPVPTNYVMSKARNIIRMAKKDIIVTMDMIEELTNPLPISYHTFLEKRADDGIRITRYGFGTKRDYIKLASSSSNIRFVYAGPMARYQRMIVVDRKRALFKLGNQVYYTEFADLAACLARYTEVVNRKHDRMKGIHI